MLYRPPEGIGNRSNSSGTRVRIAILVLLVLSVMGTTLRLFAGTLHLVREPFVDPIVRYEQRFKPLQNVLPPRVIFGFVTDSTSPNEIEKRQRLVSYVLSPVLIDWQSDWPLVIGDFADPAAARDHIGAGLRVRHDFGDGVLLLERDK